MSVASLPALRAAFGFSTSCGTCLMSRWVCWVALLLLHYPGWPRHPARGSTSLQTGCVNGILMMTHCAPFRVNIALCIVIELSCGSILELESTLKDIGLTLICHMADSPLWQLLRQNILKWGRLPQTRVAKARPSEGSDLSWWPTVGSEKDLFLLALPGEASLLVLLGDGMFQAQLVIGKDLQVQLLDKRPMSKKIIIDECLLQPFFHVGLLRPVSIIHHRASPYAHHPLHQAKQRSDPTICLLDDRTQLPTVRQRPTFEPICIRSKSKRCSNDSQWARTSYSEHCVYTGAMLSFIYSLFGFWDFITEEDSAPRVRRLHLMVVDLHRRRRMADRVLRLLVDIQMIGVLTSVGILSPSRGSRTKRLISSDMSLDTQWMAVTFRANLPCYILWPARTAEQSFWCIDAWKGDWVRMDKCSYMAPLGIEHFFDAFCFEPQRPWRAAACQALDIPSCQVSKDTYLEQGQENKFSLTPRRIPVERKTPAAKREGDQDMVAKEESVSDAESGWSGVSDNSSTDSECTFFFWTLLRSS